MKRKKLYVIVVGVKNHPMFTLLPYKTTSQRDKYFRKLEKDKTVTLPTDDSELKVLPLRYLALATITTERNFSDFVVEKGADEDGNSTSKETDEEGN